MARKYEPKGRFAKAIHNIEETVIALLLGLMTVITFINVVLRYGFNSQIIWGLEVVLILFAWLVLFGIAYGFKVTAHLGVDAVLVMLSAPKRRFLNILAALICVFYAVLLLKGAWDYWAPFAALQPTTGRWLPTGFAEGVRDRAFYITDQIPMLGMFRWLEDAINYGDEYDKLPRVIPYAMLPFAGALILLRTVQAAIGIIQGTRDSMIVSHEAEDAVADIETTRKEQA